MDPARRPVFRSFLILLLLCFVPPAGAVVYRVDADAPGPVRDGAAWDTAFPTVQQALAAVIPGDEVWVAAGQYTGGSASVRPDVGFYGGFAGTETTRDERDWRSHETVLTFPLFMNALTPDGGGVPVVDGFTFKTPVSPGGVYSAASAAIHVNKADAIIRNNTITGFVASTVRAGIDCSGGSPQILNNTIRDVRVQSGGGIVLVNARAIVANNVLTGNSAKEYGGGIAIVAAAPGAPTVTIRNNTLIGNVAPDGGGVIVGAGVSCDLVNNIIAFNGAGVVSADAGDDVTMRHNAVYGNVSGDYVGVPDATGHDGNIGADPDLAAPAYGDVRPLLDSVCVDAGEDTGIDPGEVDVLGRPRIAGANVDIGAVESDGTAPVPAMRIVRVRPDGDDANDGSGWDRAMKTVQAAINAASTGGEVWVAAGTYRQRLTLPPFVSLFGGFSGHETERDARDPGANPSVIDAEATGTTLTVRGGSPANTVDGFILRNGKGVGSANPVLGGNVTLINSALRLSHNVIEGGASDKGGGVSCFGAPIISHNVFRSNSAATQGGAIYLAPGSSAVIRDNVMDSNQAVDGGAVYGEIRRAMVAQNTILRSTSSGSVPTRSAIYLVHGAPQIVNNIVAFSRSGAGVGVATALPFDDIVRNNCIFGNAAGPYRPGNTPTGADPNLLADPRLANIPVGDAHIQPDSPCIDAGDSSVVLPGETDMDGQPRIQGAAVDIGADESDGTTHAPFAVRVKPDGDDAKDGSDWANAKKTVQAAMDAVAAAGPGEVWVAAGVYAGNLTMKLYVGLFGGFTGTETRRDERDFQANVTVLDAGGSGRVVSFPVGTTGPLDGFTIRNGRESNGGGINVTRSNAVIRNNIFHDNTSTSQGGGIYCQDASPVIEGNTFLNNTAKGAGAIYVTNGPARILDNRFLRNTATVASYSSYAAGGAIFDNNSALSGAGTVIARNLFLGNQAVNTSPGPSVTPYGSALALRAGRVTDNIFASNSITAVYLDGSVTLANNTLLGNAGGRGAVWVNSGAPNLANNLIAHNGAGVYVTSGATPVLRHNNVFGNTVAAYTGITDPTGTDGNIAADPRLASLEYGDVHIQPDSPCRDAGDNSYAFEGGMDTDGEPRVLGAAVDIGADESDGTPWSVVPRIVRVSPTGDDANDGSTWAKATRTIVGAMDALGTGGEVWVAAGTYPANLRLRSFVRLYGGFHGTSETPESRVPAAFPSVLDGSAQSFTATVSAVGVTHGSLDGFTIRGGTRSGVWLSGSSIRIANNLIVGNSIGLPSSPPTLDGAGISVWSGAPEILNNRIVDNAGAGITGGEYGGWEFVEPRIDGNIMIGNSYGAVLFGRGTLTNNTIVQSDREGIILWSPAPHPIVANNILAYNNTGLTVFGYQAPDSMSFLRNNCVFGNRYPINYYGIPDQTGQNGNISMEPKFAGFEVGDVHIQPGSPCVDAGDNSVVQPGAIDMDGQPRIQGASVDIGADESDGTVWAIVPRIVRVIPTGDDANDGTQWTSAKRTVQAALNSLPATGGEVWVAQGVYAECVTLPAYTRLYGGFGGTEAERIQRDWAAHPTVLDGGQRATVVTIPPGSRHSVVDGFTIRNGQGVRGGGIFAGARFYEVAHNTITGNRATGAVVVEAEQTLVTTGIGGGLYATTPGDTHDNQFRDNTAKDTGAGACIPPGDEASGAYTTPSVFMNNTVVGNRNDTATTGGGLMAFGSADGGRVTVVANNIIAHNTGGLNTRSISVVKNNNVFGNGTDYYDLSDPTGKNGNIKADPRFVDHEAGDLHIRPDSPCREAGDSSVVEPGALDIDGQPRLYGVAVDIGADEAGLSPAMMNVVQALRIGGGLDPAPSDAPAPFDLLKAVDLARQAAGLQPFR